MVALALSLELCINKSIGPLEIEGDSLICVQVVSMGKVTNWKLDIWVIIIKRLMREVGEYSLSHVYREVNYFADCLANHATTQIEDVHIDVDPSFWPSLTSITDKDKTMTLISDGL
ncbi:hypothetical protein SUGI_0562870 [Cryptomeria japonica]|nr:hypothetical protein SUGI_0562870 [Cryptomeria japonica]